MLGSSTCIIFSHVHRSDNKIAHNLARYVKNVRSLSVWVEDVPPHLVDVLFAEPSWFYNSSSLHSQKKKKNQISYLTIRDFISWVNWNPFYIFYKYYIIEKLVTDLYNI